MKSLLAKLKAWWGRIAEQYRPKQLPQPQPEPQPVPVKPTMVDAPINGKRVEPPVTGGECVSVPYDLDVRFDVWSPSKGDYVFAGNLLRKHIKIMRNTDGTFRLEMPDVTVQGIVYRAMAYNHPTSATPKTKGNICESWKAGGVNTFRFWFDCYEVEK